MSFSLLIIDPQVDFHGKGSLAVDGADNDSVRIANFIRSNIGNIDSIIITLDTHAEGHIAQQSFWEDIEGNQPSLFSIISNRDIVTKKWQPKDKTLLQHCIDYTQKLEEKGKFMLTIWPNHCIQDTSGHDIEPHIEEAVTTWETVNGRKAMKIPKGQNILTEMYSVFQAEVPLESDPNTLFNQSLLKHLQEQRKILICGQALSHCVNYSTRDLVDNWSPRATSDLIIIADGSSAVHGCETHAQEFLHDMERQGVIVSTFPAVLEHL